MYLQAPTFSARFAVPLCGLTSLAEGEFDSVKQVQEKLAQLRAVSAQSQLEAVMVHFDLKKTNGTEYHRVDDGTAELIEATCKELGVSVQHYFNERLAAYDEVNNSLTPRDFGISLPDGSIKIVWFQDRCAHAIEHVVKVLSLTVNSALAVQNMTFGRETIDEFNGDTPSRMMERRRQVLFEVGGWPSSDDMFNVVSFAKCERVLAKYRAIELDVFDTENLDKSNKQCALS